MHACRSTLEDPTAADGAVVHLQEGSRRLGRCPSAALVSELVAWLRGAGHDVFATDQISEVVPASEADRDVAAGVLAVAVSRDLGEYILWFRRPTEKTIDWAGDPHKVEIVTEAGHAPRLSPRGSFALWRELVRGRCIPWDDVHIEAASTLRRVLLGGVRLRAAELRQLNERLLEADRAKDSFIALVGHELRTPLNAIVGWAQLLQAGAVPEERWDQALDVISRNAMSQAQIIEDLLDVSRIVSGKMTIEVASVDLAAVIDSALESNALALQAKDLRLKRTIDSNAAVLGDAARLRQVVSNLVTNAIKFTPKGGSITISLRRDSSDLELVVADSGQGIAPDFLPHVFESFRQADTLSTRRSQGLGLGLAIVRKLVELHGGRVWAESPGLGLGSTFRVRIPVAPVLRNDTPERGVPRVARPRGLLNGMRCLVVEDERDARELVAFVLGGEGAVITEAGDALTALQLLATERFDIVVSDIGMPDLDGLAMIRRLRAMDASPNRSLPAVALTAFTRAIDRTTALEAGFDAHVPKPVDPGELVAVIASVTARLNRR